MKKKSKRPFHVAFFGDAHIPQKDPVFVDAFDCSQLLAQKKCTILNGGGPGIMLASTLGAKSVQGRVELVVIDPKNEPKNNYEGQSPKNISLANRIFTLKSYQGRINKLIKLSDAYVIFYGGTGTLAEMAYVWSKAKFAYPHQRPLIFFGKKWRKIISTLSRELNLEKIEQKICFFANSPDDVLKILSNFFKNKTDSYSK
ncbi:LOG family protein [Candidatus Shapirobacteria bacterium]|nr:LOG family protein [Candidatus Shapirobacteria bacterium]